MESHPTAPILATSGLDDDIKIWIPSSETPPKMGELATTVKKNIKKRDQEIASRPNELDGQIMWQLINHFQSEHRRNRVCESLIFPSFVEWLLHCQLLTFYRERLVKVIRTRQMMKTTTKTARIRHHVELNV